MPLKVTLENPSGPALPLKYNQSVAYMKGRAKFEFYAATAATYFSVFSVGTANAVNQSIFIPGMQYDGIADVKSLRFEDSANAAGILMGNAIFRGSDGIVGIDARNSGFTLNYFTKIMNKFVLRDIKAGGSASAYLMLGSSPLVDSLLPPPSPPPYETARGYVIVAGGNLQQDHGGKIYCVDSIFTQPGFYGLITNPNVNSHGVAVGPAALNNARLGRISDGTMYSLPYRTVDNSLSGSTSPN